MVFKLLENRVIQWSYWLLLYKNGESLFLFRTTKIEIDMRVGNQTYMR
jgi:hypothetical protein